MNHIRNCNCDVCKHFHDVEIPNDLISDMLSGEVVIFAGAGISTESQQVLGISFFETIKGLMNYYDKSVDFPKLMELFCKQTNGRFKLIDEIKKRFNNIDSFPELREASTRFHRALGTFFPVKDIITTNWDTYFERYCFATPFVNDRDLSFWNAAKRRVLKIHGSIDNLSSIVATKEDYDKCLERLNSEIIGGFLKTILATKTIVFVGYSMSDSDFLSVYKLINQQMGSFKKQAYVVTPFPEEAEKFSKEGLHSIITDGAFFIEKIKEIAVSEGSLISDDIFDYAEELLDKIRIEHELLNDTVCKVNYPQVIYSGSYQDGLIHSLQRALERRYSGDYSCCGCLSIILEKYETLKSEMIKEKRYFDVAYIEGYKNGIHFLVNKGKDEDFNVPSYFAFGCKEEMYNIIEFLDFIINNENAHKTSLSKAKEMLKRCKNPESVVFHHPPYF